LSSFVAWIFQISFVLNNICKSVFSSSEVHLIEKSLPLPLIEKSNILFSRLNIVEELAKI